MARVLNLLSERDRKLFSAEMFSLYNETAARAAEIAEETVEEFLGNLRNKSVQGSLDDLNVEVETSSGSIQGHPYIKYTIVVDHPIFDLLDEGHPESTPLDAHDYGLKVFPLAAARSKNFGNQPITQANSLKLHTPRTEDKTIFSRFIRRPVKPRNFVPRLEKAIEDALAKEGIKIDVKVVSR